MAIKQLSVFVENKQGMLVKMVKDISDANINIRAMSIADTKDFGILRLIVSDVDAAKAALSEDAMLNITPVVAVKMEDKAGALTGILTCLDQAGINVEYMYAFTGAEAFGAYVVLRVDDAATAEMNLQDAGFTTLDDEAMKAL